MNVVRLEITEAPRDDNVSCYSPSSEELGTVWRRVGYHERAPKATMAHLISPRAPHKVKLLPLVVDLEVASNLRTLV